MPKRHQNTKNKNTGCVQPICVIAIMSQKGYYLRCGGKEINLMKKYNEELSDLNGILKRVAQLP